MTRVDELIMVPRPRELRLSDGGPALSLPVAERPDDGLPAQGFMIDFAADGVELRHADDAGLRYGRGLLAQIRSQCDDAWPAGRIVDHPDLPTRGYMLDVSRGRVPTRATLQRIVEICDLLRLNQLQLYTEHTFAYAAHEQVWRHASPLTPDDVRWLDALCADHGVELVANQNTFGHMEHWFSAGEDYLRRAEKPEGFEILGMHRAPMTLAPTADNAAFALGLVAELMPHFTSTKINIGCDETWELGKGASAADAAERGIGRVYLDYLRRILDPLLEQGLQPQFWGDIIAGHPDLVADLPAGGTAVAWDYEAPWAQSDVDLMRATFPERFADPLLDFDHKFDGFTSTVAPFVAGGYPFWVAPGTGGWSSLIGRLETAYGNLLDTAEVGLAHGAEGFLITDWGDRGHLQPPSVSYPPLVYGAALAWSVETNRDLAVAPVLDAFVLGDASGRAGAALETLGRAHAQTGLVAFNASVFQLALMGGAPMVAGEVDPDRLTATLDDLDRAVADLRSAELGASDGAIVAQELTAATRLARHGGVRLLREATGTGPSDAELGADLEEAIGLHEAAWAERSRPGGKERGLAELEGLRASYRG